MLMLFMRSPGPQHGHCDSGFQSIEMRERKREEGGEDGAGGGERLGLLPGPCSCTLTPVRAVRLWAQGNTACTWP